MVFCHSGGISIAYETMLVASAVSLSCELLSCFVEPQSCNRFKLSFAVRKPSIRVHVNLFTMKPPVEQWWLVADQFFLIIRVLPLDELCYS